MMPEPIQLNAIETPYLLVDGAIASRNIQKMANYAQSHGLKVRPHIKTHKSLHLWKLQSDARAIGATTAKPSECELFAASANDLLLAYPVVTNQKAKRLVKIARSGCTLRVACDSIESLEVLSQNAVDGNVTIGVLIDLDVGHRRTGIETALIAADLSEQASKMKNIRFDGLFTFPGHIDGPASEQSLKITAWASQVSEYLDLLQARGLRASIVSGGSTPTAYQSHLNPYLTEIRPGTYVYNDSNTLLGGYCQLEDCAARIVSTVVSTSVSGQFVLDAGSKTLAADRNHPVPTAGFGLIPQYPQAFIRSINEEHAMVELKDSSSAPRLGDRVSIIPNHICPCVNLHSQFWWKVDESSAIPLPVDARGLVT